MSPVAADTVHSLVEEQSPNSTADNVTKAAHAAAQSSQTSSETPIGSHNAGENPTHASFTQQDMPEVHELTQCSGAYCFITVPHSHPKPKEETPATSPSNGKDTAGEAPSTTSHSNGKDTAGENPSVSEPSVPAVPADIPEMHTDTQCSGAYCWFVNPDTIPEMVPTKTAEAPEETPATSEPEGKDTAGEKPTLSDLSAPADVPETPDTASAIPDTIPEVAPTEVAETTPEAPLTSDSEGKDMAGESTSAPTDSSAPEGMPHMHIDTPCSGAYCNGG
ncbi:hypothetical protein CALCODRAFT_484064 [Calocera cornea HHB12733]|uniref:Uncharacterized protein n=1 Tax=Calocera cornea HHB12733 TaxID=1353952 RepID=A0A165F665_9BASI|nr:hypothetical protein CALCODRAFT_484064 [Calocera cornea HHB12733]